MGIKRKLYDSMMQHIIKSGLVMIIALMVVNVQGAEELPPAVKGFCEMAFAGKIARKGRKFNATDVAEKGVPQRRIIGYLVGKDYAYLWYEHGGRVYHQHLVKFSNTPPYEVKESYVFDSTKHKDIRQLVNDSRFLASHISNQCGL